MKKLNNLYKQIVTQAADNVVWDRYNSGKGMIVRNGRVVGEFQKQGEITQIPKMGKLLWHYLLLPNSNNFIYHFLRQLQGQHNWSNIENMLKEALTNSQAKISFLVGKNQPVTLAIPLALRSGKIVAIYPSAIIDSDQDNFITFHIDPKQYRSIKEKFGYNIQCTSLNLQYIKKYPNEAVIKDMEHTQSTTGFEIQNGGNYWYKIYGAEKGQLHKFKVHKEDLILLEDLIPVFDTAIDWYDQQKAIKKQKDDEARNYKANLLDNGAKLYKNQDPKTKANYDKAYTLKGEQRIKFLQTLIPQQLKNVESYAYYCYAYHYDIYAKEHKTAEYAEDWHYDAQKRWLESIRDKDYSIATDCKNVLINKKPQN